MQAATQTPTPPTPDPTSGAQRLGTPIVLTGAPGPNGTSGEQVTVTVKKIVNPTSLTTAGPYGIPVSPGSGYRFIAVQFQVTNTGTQPYLPDDRDASLLNSTSYADFNSVRVGGPLDPTHPGLDPYQGFSGDEVIAAGPSFGRTDTKLEPGQSAIGYVAFHAPTEFLATLTQIWFQLDTHSTTNNAGGTGVWTVG